MTKVLIIGGGGMVGQKLVHQLLKSNLTTGAPLDITLFDIAFPSTSPPSIKHVIGNLGDPAEIQKIATQHPDIIYHLAAIVSGEAEADFDKGWQVNMFTMWTLLEAIRAQKQESGGTYKPKIVFTSSIAVFGGPFPNKIDDEFLSAPQTSYGAQKATCELMLSDYSRKGFVDGISLRLPTICVRPGKPNLAASGFFSGIIREPLNGHKAYLPVADTVRHWHASPRAGANFLIHAATLDTALLENRRALNLPGVSCTVAEQIEALRKAAGQSVVDLIVPRADEAVAKIVDGWPQNFVPKRALALGFKAEANFDEIIATYLEDDLPTLRSQKN